MINYCKQCKHIRLKRGYPVWYCSSKDAGIFDKFIAWENSRACENFEPKDEDTKHDEL